MTQSRAWRRLLIATVGVVLAMRPAISGAAPAGTVVAPGPAPHMVSELRLGMYAHDAYPNWLPSDLSKFRFDQIGDVNVELLFRSPDIDAFTWLGSPRPTLGVTVNLAGRESLMHLGLTWHVPVLDTPFYVEGMLGGAIHNGELGGVLGAKRPQGCRLGFYSGVGLGANLSDKITATLSYEHMSNADLCADNFGLSNVGIRIGIKFD